MQAQPLAHEPDDSLFFNVLAGEMASHLGDYQTAYNYYHRASIQTDLKFVAERHAQLAIHHPDPQKAIKAFKYWISLEPHNHDTHIMLATLLIRNNQIDAAVIQFAEMVEKTGASEEKQAKKKQKPKLKSRVDLFVEIAEQLRSTADHKVAQQIMQTLVDRFPKMPEAKFGQAWLVSKTNQLELALTIVGQTLRLRPGWEKAVALRVKLLQKLGRDVEALAFLKDQVKQFPKEADIYMHYGRFLFKSRKLPEAIQQFETALRLRPDHNKTELLHLLSALYIEQGQYARAEAMLIQILEKDDKPDSIRYVLGELAELQDKIDIAIKYYSAIGKGKFYFQARLRVASLESERDIPKALSILHGLSPDTKKQQYQRLLLEATFLEKGKQYAEAVQIYNQALAEFPEDEELLYARAMASDQVGDLATLERDLHAILKKNPKHYHAWNALGYTLVLRTTRYVEAKKYLEKALALRPDDYYTLDSMGWLLYKTGKLDEALDYLQRAWEASQQEDVEIAAHFGEVRWMQGNKAGAEAIWKTAKELDAKHPVLIETLRRLKNKR